MHAGLATWGLGLRPDMFAQFVDCNFLYADRDLDGHLSLVEWVQLFKLMSEVPPSHAPWRFAHRREHAYSPVACSTSTSQYGVDHDTNTPAAVVR